jgi:hypothetical protein
MCSGRVVPAAGRTADISATPARQRVERGVAVTTAGVCWRGFHQASLPEAVGTYSAPLHAMMPCRSGIATHGSRRRAVILRAFHCKYVANSLRVVSDLVTLALFVRPSPAEFEPLAPRSHRRDAFHSRFPANSGPHLWIEMARKQSRHGRVSQFRAGM